MVAEVEIHSANNLAIVDLPWNSGPCAYSCQSTRPKPSHEPAVGVEFTLRFLHTRIESLVAIFMVVQDATYEHRELSCHEHWCRWNHLQSH